MLLTMPISIASSSRGKTGTQRTPLRRLKLRPDALFQHHRHRRLSRLTRD
jgi:hypothetical protein